MVASRAEHAPINRVDIAVYSKDNTLQLVAEVKNRPHATTEWAAAMRRNLVAHLSLPESPFFLLALPDRFYLWRDIAAPLIAIPPDYDIDAVPLLAPYVGNNRQSLISISEYGLALAVSSWLTSLINSHIDKEQMKPDQAWLLDSGLYHAIKGGAIRTEATL
jgi:hypothetical protein